MSSDKSFGITFSILFLILFFFFYKFFFLYFSLLFIVISFIRPNFLHLLNYFFFKIGRLILFLLHPIIIRINFFLIFLIISLIMKLFRYDPLLISKKNKFKSSYWISRAYVKDKIRNSSSKDQY